MLTLTHLTGMILTLTGVALAGIWSMKKVNSANDFAVGGRSAGAPLITGTIVGTLVGGASTIGTSQLAFTFGFSAWWFTLGAGAACIIMGLFMAGPLQRSGASTGPGLLADAYGARAGLYAGIFSSFGIFLNIIAQVLAAVALIVSMFAIPPVYAAFISVFFIIVYVIFGGVWGTGLVGIIKLFLLYTAMVAAGVIAFIKQGGAAGFTASFDPFPWFSLFGRGAGKDLAAAFSMIVGVISTQTYLQAMFSGRNSSESRKGALISGIIIPPIGLAGILAGLHMKAHFPAIEAKSALPLFILQYLPDWLGGVCLATLFISVIGTGAGLVLGVSTMLSRDIYKKFISPDASDRKLLLVSRILVALVSALTLLFVAGNLNSLILKWSFLSMGLRGAVMFLPLLGTLFFRKYIKSSALTLAVVLAPASAILWGIFASEYADPLYPGIITGLIILSAGCLTGKEKEYPKTEYRDISN